MVKRNLLRTSTGNLNLFCLICQTSFLRQSKKGIMRLMENLGFIAVVIIFGFLFFGPHTKSKKKDDKKGGGDKKEGGDKGKK